ncbi:hypothetical protein AAC387_Pa06g1686 [Persea americana]
MVQENNQGSSSKVSTPTIPVVTVQDGKQDGTFDGTFDAFIQEGEPSDASTPMTSTPELKVIKQTTIPNPKMHWLSQSVTHPQGPVGIRRLNLRKPKKSYWSVPPQTRALQGHQKLSPFEAKQ